MSLVERAKNILITPKTEWPVIETETPDTTAIMTGYLLPLALIGAVATFIGWGFIGAAGIHSIGWGVAQAVIYLIAMLAGVFIAAAVVNALAPSFGSQKDFGRALQLVVYSYTPGLVLAILNIFPLLAWITWIGTLYGFYLMYLGLPYMMKTPDDRRIVYILVVIVVQIIVYFVIAGILGAIFASVLGVGMMMGG